MKLKKKNKMLFGAMASATIVASPAIVIACGSDNESKSDKTKEQKQKIDKALAGLSEVSVNGINKNETSDAPSQNPSFDNDGDVEFLVAKTANSDEGTLTLKITGEIGSVTGTKTKEIVIKGFLSAKQNAINKALDGLTEKHVKEIDFNKRSNDSSQNPSFDNVGDVEFSVVKTANGDEGILTLKITGKIGPVIGQIQKTMVIRGFNNSKESKINQVLDGLIEKDVKGINKDKTSEDASQKPTIKDIEGVSFTITKTVSEGKMSLSVVGHIGNVVGANPKILNIDHFHIRAWTNAGHGVKRGFNQNMFQAKNGDIYVTSQGNNLQVLKNGDLSSDWEDAKGSNIDDGAGSSFMQAKNGDIYSMATGKPLQVLKDGDSNNSWTIVANSGITNGENGKIIQTSNDDIYVLSAGVGLRVMVSGQTGWADAKGSNINNGTLGSIMQAKNGDIYSMGEGAPLQVLKGGVAATGWTVVTDSGISNGEGGKLLQAKNGDIYGMSNYSKLRVMVDKQTSWADAKDSNISFGLNATIMQASNGDIYSMVYDQPLQVLKGGVAATGWTVVADSGITDGTNGSIFQASNGDLYVMSERSKLRVLKKDATKWVDSGAGILSGNFGKIMQDQNKNIWASASFEELKVFK